MFLSLVVVFIILVLTVFFQNKKPNPEKIFGVYSQPGKWYHFKYISMLTVLLARKFQAKLKRPPAVEKLEKLQHLSVHPKAFDAVFFQAVSRDGFYFCGGVERRHAAKINGLFYLVDVTTKHPWEVPKQYTVKELGTLQLNITKFTESDIERHNVPNLGLLESINLPKTLLDADPEAVLYQKEFSGGGLSFAPVEPMRKWRLTFEGKMKSQKNPNHLVTVKLDGIWHSTIPHFNIESDSDSRLIAQAIAREEWSKDYFKALKESHQTHYEQMGYFKGSLVVDNESYQLQMDAMRDHSFGFKRDWTLLHRYIFHMFYLEDNTRASIGVVSHPCTSSHLELGYVVTSEKIVHPIQSCDLLLYQQAEDRKPPWDYGFSFKAGDRFYTAQIRILCEDVHFKGNDTEALLFERFFECEVNGVKGRGISEWHYNNTK